MRLSLFHLYSVLVVLSLAVAVVWSGLRCVRALHMLQLDSYFSARLLRWLWAAPAQRLLAGWVTLALVGLGGVHAVLWVFGATYGPSLVLGVWCVTGCILLLRHKPSQAKKALVYTTRAIRILAVAVALCIVMAGAFGWYAVGQLLPGYTITNAYKAVMLVLAGGFMTVHLAPLVVSLANLLLAPVQKTINRVYLRAARKRLRQFAPTVVGITGSYGKTSTKYFLHALLSERYSVLKTPQSFNTLMGICRVINDELRPQHQVFVVEMGAYSRGIIAEIADFVRPQIGILTAIGPQHLERFKTMENIEAAKYELIEALPDAGVAVFNNDDPRCRQLADHTTGVKVLRYGMQPVQPGLHVWAEDISHSAQGLTFTLVDSTGQRVPTHTMLLGRHNVLNLLGAACVALEMGLSLEEVGQAILKLEATPHRLQLLQGAGGVTVLDDSYNSNPVGAAAALEVLQEFKTGQRVLVTPGMVELGEIEAEQNEAFGAQAARVCDYVLLVGPRQTQAILRGLERERFPHERIRVVQDLVEATSELRRLVRSGDVVLFENDLPDLYAET
jgi:UDP-N-acetylmuramoyl-tripeptide--D-alanyl-D-alanine ligase